MMTRATVPDATADELRAALRLDPHDLPARLELAELLFRRFRSGHGDDAHTDRDSPIGPTTEMTSAFNDVVRLLEVIRHYRVALQSAPLDATIHVRLATALKLHGQFDEANRHFRVAVSLDEQNLQARAGLADLLFAMGEVEEAIHHLQCVLSLEPRLDRIHSTVLHASHYREMGTPRDLFEEHRRYGSLHDRAAEPGPWTAQVTDRDDLGRRLRIGYLSPDFRTHSVAYFIEPLIAGHDRQRFEIICYANVCRPDAVTNRLIAAADAWRDVRGLNDSDLVQLIRGDKVDILVDLAGHTLGGRLTALAERAAPIQVTYLGYPDTTGLRTMDYRLTDAWADPDAEADSLCTERLVRLSTGFLCYQPPDTAPEVGSLPAATRGQVTFGSFNDLNKVSPEVIATWAELLKSVPDSSLMLKATALAYPAARRSVYDRFLAHGIGQDRLQLMGRIPSTDDHLQRYQDVDIALDTFPYNGTTTTCEALWMGVPVVGLAGRTHVGRVGVSLLSQVGLSDLIARSPAEYVELAAGLADNRGRLTRLRRELRGRMAASPLTDAATKVRSIEEAYRMMWAAGPGHGQSSHIPAISMLTGG